MDAVAEPRYCLWCKKSIPDRKRKGVKYCSRDCGDLYYRRVVLRQRKWKPSESAYVGVTIQRSVRDRLNGHVSNERRLSWIVEEALTEWLEKREVEQ